MENSLGQWKTIALGQKMLSLPRRLELKLYRVKIFKWVSIGPIKILGLLVLVYNNMWIAQCASFKPLLLIIVVYYCQQLSQTFHLTSSPIYSTFWFSLACSHIQSQFLFKLKIFSSFQRSLRGYVRDTSLSSMYLYK